MTTPEGKVKNWCRRKGGAFDVVFPGHVRIPPRGGFYSINGVADDILCWQGVFIAIEVKPNLDSEPTALQLKFLKEVVAAGGVGAVLKGKDIHRLYAIRAAAVKIIDQRRFVNESGLSNV